MQAFIAYVTAHWVELGAAYIAFQNFARLVVKLTPTPKDDSVLDKVTGFLGHVALITPAAPKTDSAAK